MSYPSYEKRNNIIIFLAKGKDGHSFDNNIVLCESSCHDYVLDPHPSFVRMSSDGKIRCQECRDQNIAAFALCRMYEDHN